MACLWAGAATPALAWCLIPVLAALKTAVDWALHPRFYGTHCAATLCLSPLLGLAGVYFMGVPARTAAAAATGVAVQHLVVVGGAHLVAFVRCVVDMHTVRTNRKSKPLLISTVPLPPPVPRSPATLIDVSV